MKTEDLGLPLDYQDFPEFFDTDGNGDNTLKKNEAVEGLLRQYKVAKVLDMTCGTGAQVFYLHDKGYDVVGADFSPGLLDIARKKTTDLGFNVNFIDGDMQELQVGKFDAVITIDNAIGHLVTSDFEMALRNIHSNLSPDGIYVFDILNLEAMTDDVINADNERMSDTRVAADGTKISNVRRTEVDREKGLFTSHNTFTFEQSGERKSLKNKCSLQIYTPTQLLKILEKNGFSLLEQHKVDAYTFAKDENGYSILTVAQKQ